MRLRPLIFALIAQMLMLPALAIGLETEPSGSETDRAWKQLTRPRWASDSPLFDLYPLHGAQTFGDQIVVNCNGFKIVDCEKHCLIPLSIPGADKIYSVCDDPTGRLYALCSSKADMILKICEQGSWSEVGIPKDMYGKDCASAGKWVLGADGNDVILGFESKCFLLHEKVWQSVPLNGMNLYAGPSNQSALRNQKLYRSHNRGEWGGSLYLFDLATGKSTGIAGGNVNHLKLDRDNKLWFTTGTAHLGLQGARLNSFACSESDTANGVNKNTDLKTYAEVLGIRAGCFTESQPAKDRLLVQKDWPLRPTSFDGLCIRDDGTILVASPDYGILSYKDGAWQQLTEDWRGYAPICGLEVTSSDVAVLPVDEVGIVLYDLKNKKYDFILPDYCSKK